MKTLIKILSVVAFAAVTFALVGFTSSSAYQLGRAEKEYTMATVAYGESVTRGQWVVYKFSDASEAGYDTGAVVGTIATENSGMVAGVADSGGDSGAMIRIVTRGFVNFAKIDGVDSGATGIARGEALAIAPKAGYAGSAMGTYPYAAASTAQAAGTQIIGYAVDAVTGRLNAAAFADTSTTYDVYVMCR